MKFNVTFILKGTGTRTISVPHDGGPCEYESLSALLADLAPRIAGGLGTQMVGLRIDLAKEPIAEANGKPAPEEPAPVAAPARLRRTADA